MTVATTIYGGHVLRKYKVTVGLLAMTFTAGVLVGQATQVKAAGQNRVLEIRTYTAHPGRLPALVDRMGHGEGEVFARLGMKDRKSTRLNSSHIQKSRMPSSA